MYFKKKAWGKAEPIKGEFVLWLTVRMHSKTVKANPRYFFTITRAVFEERVHVGCITMFEETEATMATGHKGFRWHNKGTMVKESVTARFHGFRMKAAAVEDIDHNVRTHLGVVMRDEDEPYRAEDPEAPPAEVNRMLPPPVPREQNEHEGEVIGEVMGEQEQPDEPAGVKRARRSEGKSG
eukprot:g77600.t1